MLAFIALVIVVILAFAMLGAVVHMLWPLLLLAAIAILIVGRFRSRGSRR